MYLASILDPDLIKIHESANDTEEALTMLIDAMKEHYKFEIDKNKVIEKIHNREDLGHTIIGDGVWIPHARLNEFNDLLIGVFIPKTPFEIDNTKIKIIVLILISTNTSGLYLNILSAMAKIAQNTQLFENILNQEKPEGIIDIIKKQNLTIKKEISITDIMRTDFISATPDMSLKELIDTFFKFNTTYAPVVDKNNNFIGEVDIQDVLKKGIPEYALMMSNLKFLTSLSPFEKLLENEENIPVKDIMHNPDLFFTPETSVIEAALELSKYHCREIPVIKEKKIVGIICCKDIISKVLRI